MNSMAYPSYDTYARHLPRPQTLPYPTPQAGYYYGDQHQQVFNDPAMPGRVEPFSQPAYQIYAPRTAPLGRRLSGPAYDGLDMRNSYYPSEQPMTAVGYPPVIPHAMPRRQRRHSTVSFSDPPAPMDPFRRPSSVSVAFRRRHETTYGITLPEAFAHVRLAHNHSYSSHDFHPNQHGMIRLKLQWRPYAKGEYEISIHDSDGSLSLEGLARRIARAVVHYLQLNVIPVLWTQVGLLGLEETSHGVWRLIFLSPTYMQ